MEKTELTLEQIKQIMKVVQNTKDTYLKIFEKHGTTSQMMKEYNLLSDMWLELYELQSPLLNK